MNDDEWMRLSEAVVRAVLKAVIAEGWQIVRLKQVGTAEMFGYDLYRIVAEVSAPE